MKREERIKLARQIYLEETAKYLKARAKWEKNITKWKDEFQKWRETPEQQRGDSPDRPWPPTDNTLLRMMSDLSISKRTAEEYATVVGYQERTEKTKRHTPRKNAH